MNIKSAKYQSNNLTGEGNASICAVINDITYSVPIDPNNRHYQAIQEWVAEGNTIEDAD